MAPAASPRSAPASRITLRRKRLRVLVPSDGYHVQGEVVRALRALGHDAVAVPLTPPAGAPSTFALQAMAHAIRHYRPDLLVSINYIGLDRTGALDSLLASIGLPCAVWFVDHPLFFALGALELKAQYTRLFAWDKTHVARLQTRSATKVTYLPLGCEPDKFALGLSRQADDALPISFVGSSMVSLSAKWRARLAPDEAARGESLVAPLLAGTTDIHALTPAPTAPIDRTVVMAAYAHCLASRARRKERLLAIDRGALCVFGDDGFARELPNRRVLGEVAYGPDLAVVYRRSAINFNATILQMPSAVNQRCFDVPAAGGFLLTDAQSELFELFERDKEVVSYDSLTSMQEAIARFRADPGARAAISERARSRIRQEHLYTHRLDTLLTTMRSEISQ